jgi:hypothetical protein
LTSLSRAAKIHSSKTVLIIHKKMKLTIKNIATWSIILSVFVNKYYNFNPFLDLPKVNNFLDLIISPSDIIVGLLSFGFFVLTFFYNYLKPHTKYFVKPTVTHLFVIISLLITFLIHPSFGILMIIARIFLLINIVPKLLVESNFGFRITLMIGLALSLIFDHFVLSSSLPVLLLFILSLNLNLWQRATIWTYLILNFYVALYQIVMGKSLGLSHFGEPVINANSLNIARETIIGQNVLRGYGLTQHPAMLGFVALFGLLFVYKFYPSPKNSVFTKVSSVLPFISSLLSLSRISLLTFLFSWIINAKSRMKIYPKIFLLGGILGLFLYRFFGSDKYRILDLQTWFNVTINMNILDVFLGIGYYPDFLYSYYQGLGNWQFQPTHNSLLGIFTQFGVWGCAALLGWLHFDLAKPYFDNKRKKLQEL